MGISFHFWFKTTIYILLIKIESMLLRGMTEQSFGPMLMIHKIELVCKLIQIHSY